MILAPSILSADFSRLREEVEAAEAGGAQSFHCDVMDGHFVPNLTFGPMVVAAMRKLTQKPLDVHLMVVGADALVDSFVRAGADGITVHAEACPHLHRTLSRIQAMGVRVGVALNPATPLVMIEEILDMIDLLLIMTVNPGFGGQSLIPAGLSKLANAVRMRERLGLDFDLQVDGGVSPDNMRSVVEAGADIVVAGSAVFDGVDPCRAVRCLLEHGSAETSPESMT
jgi:ribulose-phosphate 3-epimerase